MAKKATNPTTQTLLIVAGITAVAALVIDKLAQSTYNVNPALAGPILRTDLQLLPGVLAVIVVAWLFRANRKAMLLGMAAAVVVAAILFLVVGGIIRIYNPYSMLWQTYGYQTAYLVVPTFIAILAGSYAGRQAR